MKIEGSIDLSNIALGTYTIEHNCSDSLFTSITSFNFSVQQQPIVNLLIPLNNSVNTNGEVTFNFNVNIPSQCTLFLDNLSEQTDNFNIGNNSFSPILFTSNETFIRWDVNCTIDGFTGGEFHLLLINLTELPVPFFERFTVGSCPDSLEDVLILFMLFALAIVIIIFGIFFEWGLMGMLGGFMFLVLSFFIVACSVLFGIIFLSCSILIIGFFATVEDGDTFT